MNNAQYVNANTPVTKTLENVLHHLQNRWDSLDMVREQLWADNLDAAWLRVHQDCIDYTDACKIVSEILDIFYNVE